MHPEVVKGKTKLSRIRCGRELAWDIKSSSPLLSFDRWILSNKEKFLLTSFCLLKSVQIKKILENPHQSLKHVYKVVSPLLDPKTFRCAWKGKFSGVMSQSWLLVCAWSNLFKRHEANDSQGGGVNRFQLSLCNLWATMWHSSYTGC